MRTTSLPRPLSCPPAFPHGTSPAFSLVELSIVLVILGLLTGGVLSGQSLIRAAELRAVSTELQRWSAATYTFRDRYMALPGDYASASRIWNLQGGSCTTNPTSSTVIGSPGACDGNGNGTITPATCINCISEWAQYWRHLSLSGLIEGNYSGFTGANGGWSANEQNAPASKLNKGWWVMFQYPSSVGIPNTMFDGLNGNMFLLGANQISGSGAEPGAPVLRPLEAWNIDTKMDDGKPATGNVVVRERVNCALGPSGEALTTATGDGAKLSSTYNSGDTQLRCALFFRNVI